jgi:hypothetical protein
LTPAVSRADHAAASASITVDLPDPFSPTSTVMPVSNSSPARRSCAIAGTCQYHAFGSYRFAGSTRTPVNGSRTLSPYRVYRRPRAHFP